MRIILGASLILGVLATTAISAEIAPADVKFVDDIDVVESLSGVAGDPVAGREVYSNRKLGNCLACHQTSDQAEHSFHGEVGPSMDGVAERYEIATLRGIVVNSKNVFGESTLMPGFYTDQLGIRVADSFSGKTILTAQQAEDVIAYLLTLK